MIRVFGCAGERDVDFLLCEVLGLQEGDALFQGGACDGGILKDCCSGVRDDGGALWSACATYKKPGVMFVSKAVGGKLRSDGDVLLRR